MHVWLDRTSGKLHLEPQTLEEAHDVGYLAAVAQDAEVYWHTETKDGSKAAGVRLPCGVGAGAVLEHRPEELSQMLAGKMKEVTRDS
jgi:hypothetical protein